MAKVTKGQGSVITEPRTITEIQVAGFKSISEEQRIQIRPLTILAGANSSGKSSIIQPLLLLKQTLEASYDPGAILLNGPNVKFSSAEELLSRIGKRHSSDTFHVGMRMNTGEYFQTAFRKEDKMRLRIEEMEIADASGRFTLWPKMTQSEISKTGITKGKESLQQEPEDYGQGRWEITARRCFLELAWIAERTGALRFSATDPIAAVWEGTIPAVIHLPGLRGNPERAYPVTAVGPSYAGTFEKYTASVIHQWHSEDSKTLDALNADLNLLRLAGGVVPVPLNGVQIELRVGRLPDVAPMRLEDRVNIADVGIGVSQSLPVLVALHAAKPGQLVYVEQPETHLHPRAQFAMAEVLASAARRGVRVVVETHSSILLLGVQTLVAEQEGKLKPDEIRLHWFERGKDGRTAIRSGELDKAGAFGEWPQDFDDVMLETQKKYLDAADKRMFAR